MGLPSKKGLGVLNALRIKLAPRLLHSVAEMGREHSVVRRPQRMVLR